jgi:AI-2 transport protein TqsA
MTQNPGDGRSRSPLSGALVAVALTGFVLLLMHLAAEVLTPLMFAFFLTALALPVYRGLQQRGIGRGLALLLLLVGLVGGLLLLIALVLIAVGRLQEGLSAYTAQLTAQLEALEAALAGSAGATSADTGSAAGSLLGALLKAIVSAASTAVVSVVIVVFFLLEADRIMTIMRSDAVQQVPVLGQLPRMGATAVKYFGIRTRLNLLTGAGVTLICLLLGVDYPLLWGVCAFFLSYIPYIGLLTAMIPPALLALAESGWGAALLVVIGITAINLAIENVVEPGYTGRQLKLSPTVVFVSFFFWAWLLGPVGGLMSMSITVLLMLVFQGHESTHWLAEIIGRGGDEG